MSARAPAVVTGCAPATFEQFGSSEVGTPVACMTWHQALQRMWWRDYTLHFEVLTCRTTREHHREGNLHSLRLAFEDDVIRVRSARCIRVVCAEVLKDWLQHEGEQKGTEGIALSQRMRVAQSLVNVFRVACYKETRWLGMQNQSEIRAGNHRRRKRIRNVRPPTQVSNASRAANSNPPTRALCMHRTKTPHTSPRTLRHQGTIRRYASTAPIAGATGTLSAYTQLKSSRRGTGVHARSHQLGTPS